MKAVKLEIGVLRPEAARQEERGRRKEEEGRSQKKCFYKYEMLPFGTFWRGIISMSLVAMSTIKGSKSNLQLKIFQFSETDFLTGLTVTIKEKITPTTVLRTVPLAQSLGFFEQCLSNGRSQSQGSGIGYSQTTKT
ncbi:hypothetical protein QUB05_30490 [Microcoleus sp. F10-C6]|uniref:hypothetical protein n=1 Tax=unclassified Microcoleus TaxID=2642155 RepID=UPI002FD670A7